MAVVSDYTYLGELNGWGRGSDFGGPFEVGDASGRQLYANVHHRCCPRQRSRAPHDDGERL